MPTQVGSYTVRRSGADVAFWPLAAGRTVAEAEVAAAPTEVAPNSANTLVVPPRDFGIVDVLIQLSDDAVTETTIAELAPPLADRRVQAGSTVTTFPLVFEGDGTARQVRICFAVPVASATAPFEGTLRFTARTGGSSPHNLTLELPLKVGHRERKDDLFVFFLIHRKPDRRYCWMKQKVVEASDGTTVISGVEVKAKVLRDNLSTGYTERNRRVTLTTNAEGFAAFSGRPVLALPIGWPLIFNATLGGCVPRGHMVKLTSDNLPDNTAPFEPDVLRMTRSTAVNLSTRRFMLDKGHGVIYGLATSRRSQEWYGVSRLADRIGELLVARHQVPAANVFKTRTAGFSPIDPAQVTAAGAPEAGDGRYEYRLSDHHIRGRVSTVGLKGLSDVLLVRHTGDTNTAQPVADADRTRLLTFNTPRIDAIVARINLGLQSSGTQVQDGSVRWDAATSDYVYTKVRIVNGVETVVTAVVRVPITTTDWFALDDGMKEAIADRAARWSLAREIGGDGTFPEQARQSMRDTGAIDYMRAQILEQMNVPSPHAFLDHGTQGWGPSDRIRYFNNTTPHCDLYLTLHLNAGHGKGGMALVSHRTGPDAPPDEQVRIAKMFLKYIDGFDQGTRQGGITTDLPNNPAGMLYSANQVRDRYAYFELEFMDGPHPTVAGGYRYDQIVRQEFIDGVAEQIVAGIVEILTDPQPLDSLTHHDELSLW